MFKTLKSVYNFIRKNIDESFYKKQLHKLIGIQLLQGSDIKKQIRKQPFLERGKGISNITGNYEKYANEKLFVIILPETSNLKKLFDKKNYKKLKTLYLGETKSEINEAVSTPKPGIYIFIVLKDTGRSLMGNANYSRKLIGVMKKESRDVEERFRKKMIEESLTKPQMNMPQMHMGMSPPGYPPPQSYPPPSYVQPSYNPYQMQQSRVADTESKMLNTGLSI